jgi:twitching motility protein PilT
MVDHINKTRAEHVLTLEDPIELVHESQRCLVNQREVGAHTSTFARALRAALREDPDIVLVGEMRDLETVALALETANTGHLVFGTLHTATAITTVDRIINLFPAEEQNQVRGALGDTLRGVVAQTLCKRLGGGRVAALEMLVVDHAVAHQIREAQTHQIINAMSTGLARGNRLLNQSLQELVQQGTIDQKEAMDRAVDKADIQKRLKPG